ARGFEEVVILRDEALAARGDGDVDVGQAAVLAGDHAVGASGEDEFHGVVAEAGGEDAVGGDGWAAALHVAEDDVARLDARARFDGVGDEVGDAAEANGIRAGGVETADDRLAADGACAFGGADDGEAAAAGASARDDVGHGVHREGDLGQEDDVRAGGDAGVQGEPAGVAAHDL